MKLTCLFFGLVVLLSCKKDGIPASTPACVQDIITQMQKDPVRNPAGSVTRYTYKGQVVYYIPPTCCDQFSLLLTTNCRTICAPDGGLGGSGDGKCNDFYQVATDATLIWQDTRK